MLHIYFTDTTVKCVKCVIMWQTKTKIPMYSNHVYVRKIENWQKKTDDYKKIGYIKTVCLGIRSL